MSAWRYRCPNGHSAWRIARGNMKECETCGIRFEKFNDAKTGKKVATIK